MRQLMDQFIALILDQRIRLAQEDVVLHDRTVDIPRATVCKDRLESQRRKVRAEEHQPVSSAQKVAAPVSVQRSRGS